MCYHEKLCVYIVLGDTVKCKQTGFTETIVCEVTVTGAHNATLFGPNGTQIATETVENQHVTFNITDALWGETCIVKAGGKQDSVKMIPPGMQI